MPENEPRPPPLPPHYLKPRLYGFFRISRRRGENWEVTFKSTNGVSIDIGSGFDNQTAEAIKTDLQNVLRRITGPRLDELYEPVTDA